MTSIFDLAIFLGGDGVIFQVFFGMAWTGQRDAAFYVGQKVGSLPGFIWNAKDMTLSYEGETYGYTSFGIPQGTCFLIKKEDIQKKLMAAALDASPDIIQLYTKSGGISFFNQTSRRFLEFPLKTVWKDRLSLMFFPWIRITVLSLQLLKAKIPSITATTPTSQRLERSS